MAIEHGSVAGSVGRLDRMPIAVDKVGNQQQCIGGVQVPPAGTLAALTNKKLLKATPGKLRQLKVTNTSASTQWYALCDCASTGAIDETQNMVDAFSVGAGATVLYPLELEFGTGLCIANNGAVTPWSSANQFGASDSLFIARVD